MDEAVCKEENESDEGYKEIPIESDEVKSEVCVPFIIDIDTPTSSETHEPDVTFHIGNFAENGTNEFIASNEGSPLNRKNGASGDANIQTEKSKRGSRGFALGSVSDKIVPWLRARFDRKQGGKTAIQEVITLYSHDFPRDSIYFPLESFQVGQLVRQAFPNIELCKVTHKETKKRYRCYKDLYRKDDENGPKPIFPFDDTSGKLRAAPARSRTIRKPMYCSPVVIGDSLKRPLAPIGGTTLNSENPKKVLVLSSVQIKMPNTTKANDNLINVIHNSNGIANKTNPIHQFTSIPNDRVPIQPPADASTKGNNQKLESKEQLSNANRLTLEQEMLLSELPTMKTPKFPPWNVAQARTSTSTPKLIQPPSTSIPTNRSLQPEIKRCDRRVEIAKLHVAQSLDHIENQQFNVNDFQQIEEYIFERLDQIRGTRFGP